MLWTCTDEHEDSLAVDGIAALDALEVVAQRWIVERPLAWLGISRRLSKADRVSIRSAQAACLMAAFRALIKRF